VIGTRTMALAIPKLRAGTYFRGRPIEPRGGAERASATVVAESYVLSSQSTGTRLGAATMRLRSAV
jgi:hypothetical protein